MNIIGSSIAMLSGQKPPFRLLVRAIDSETGLRVDRVQWAVSDAFVVATQRVKGAQKAEIPHIEEHVSKIENVGVQVCVLAHTKSHICWPLPFQSAVVRIAIESRSHLQILVDPARSAYRKAASVCPAILMFDVPLRKV